MPGLPRFPQKLGKANAIRHSYKITGIPIGEYTKEHEELGVALGTWQKKTDFKI